MYFSKDPIGTVIEISGNRKAVITIDNSENSTTQCGYGKCVFNQKCTDCESIACQAYERKDGTDVCFIEVEPIEEPYCLDEHLDAYTRTSCGCLYNSLIRCRKGTTLFCDVCPYPLDNGTHTFVTSLN